MSETPADPLARIPRRSRVVPSAVRALSSSPVHRAQPTAEASSSAAPAPPLSPKIGQIVDQIAGLTLLEAADLVDALKVRIARFI